MDMYLVNVPLRPTHDHIHCNASQSHPWTHGSQHCAVVELDWVCIVRSAVTESTSTINYMLDGSMSHVYNWHTYNNHRLSNLINATIYILTIHIHHHPLLLVTASNCEQGECYQHKPAHRDCWPCQGDSGGHCGSVCCDKDSCSAVAR